MGGKIILPEPDANIQKCIKNFQLTPKEISKLWIIFQKLDKGKTGFVKLDVIYKRIGFKRNIISDCITELLAIEHDGEINFSDFLITICTFCMFEPPEILKFMFFVFDQDKSGTLDKNDIESIIGAVHDINKSKGEQFRGNIKGSWNIMERDIEKLSIEELKSVQERFPMIFAPAFLLHQRMMAAFMGETWWDMKKRSIHDCKEAADAIIAAKKKKKEAKIQRKKNVKIMRNMGVFKYYFCFCFRSFYDPTRAELWLSEEERAEKARKFALMKREMELKVKNPETVAWEQYQKKAVPAKGGTVAFLEEKHVATERPREERALSREERRLQRMKDADLKLKPRTAIDGDI